MKRLTILVVMVAAGSMRAEPIRCDLLIVGGTEAGVSAAISAARQGVKNIVLVNDIDWLGGQFSAEAVGAIDEWTLYRDRKVEFNRSGLFLEMLRKVRARNAEKFGLARPGNGFCASETVEPAEAARLFRDWLSPYKQITILSWHEPVAVRVEAGRVERVTFANLKTQGQVAILPKLTIDASDWGDVIRLAGAKWSAGPDSKARFGEPNAPVGPLGIHQNEMNPISYCLVLRETANDAVIARPAGYDERTFYGTCNTTAGAFAKLGWPKKAQMMNVPAFVDTAYPEGIYSSPVTIYTHRRLVDRVHNRLAPGTETILVNWPTQDYPLYDFPKHVADALEKTEAGASLKNVAAMTPSQRRIVFEDAKRHSLGMLYFLQTTVHERTKTPFRRMELTDEFGTPDKLPPKPYVREGLRLEALYMLREGDLRMQGKEPGWAKHMAPDLAFGFQFNIDFHPTRRVFLNEDRSGPWANVHTENRNWSTHTDRSGLPLRCLVPVEMKGLLGASKNIGLSSIVSSALRLHGHMMLTGEASATLSAICLERGLEPSQAVADPKIVREVQLRLVRNNVLLWPYQDLAPDDLHFEAANMLAVRSIFVPQGSVDFEAWKPVTRRELAVAVERAALSLAQSDEALKAWTKSALRSDDVADWATLSRWFGDLGWTPSPGLAARGKNRLTRAELVRNLWLAIKDRPEAFPDVSKYLTPGHDSDGDGIVDLEDALPFDRDNNGVPDRLQPK